MESFRPQNCRPITILSCLRKLFIAISNERLRNKFEFWKSYLKSIFTLFSFFEILKSKKKKFFCAFVDFGKMFDTVWREALWYKLLLNNINRKIYNIILNMCNNVKFCINYNNCKSDYFSCDMVVRQGQNVYPFLFVLFLNDLQSFLEKENLHGLKTMSEKKRKKLKY
jgi:hypothetical protein